MDQLEISTHTTMLTALALLVCIPSGCGDDQGSAGPTTTATSGISATSDDSASDVTGTDPPPATGTTADAAGTTADSAETTAATADSTGGSTGPGVDPCPPDHVCFELPGVFHVPDEATPTAIHDIPLPEGAEYSVVEVTLDVTHGGWFPEDPAGLHNIFWLHRGTFDDFTWAGGVLGYVNARGPGNDIIRTRHDLDVTDLADSRTFNINGVSLQQDHTYRVFYRYDTAAMEVLVEVREGEELVASGTDVPTTDRVRNTEGGYFIWFANPTDVRAPGPEVPSLGWAFADLRVEFIP